MPPQDHAAFTDLPHNGAVGAELTANMLAAELTANAVFRKPGPGSSGSSAPEWNPLLVKASNCFNRTGSEFNAASFTAFRKSHLELVST